MVTTLAAQTGYPIGDAEAPAPPFGWSGTPGEIGSTFTPYSIVTPGSASNFSGPFSDSHADIQLPYTVSSFGTSREQCEWICDKAREAFISLKDTVFDGIDSDYVILQVRTMTMGGIVRSANVEPATFGETDVFSVWASKA